MFAVQAGACKVFGVDQSQIIFNAMAIIRYMFCSSLMNAILINLPCMQGEQDGKQDQTDSRPN